MTTKCQSKSKQTCNFAGVKLVLVCNGSIARYVSAVISNFFFPFDYQKKGILFIQHIVMQNPFSLLKWVGIREGTCCKDEDRWSIFPKVIQVLCFALF